MKLCWYGHLFIYQLLVVALLVCVPQHCGMSYQTQFEPALLLMFSSNNSRLFILNPLLILEFEMFMNCVSRPVFYMYVQRL
jgi:hypothetical protein